MKNLFAVFTLLVLLAPTAHAISWKGIFIAGDDSIENFDNGREDLTATFARQGSLVATTQLSSSQKFIRSGRAQAANADGVISAFTKLGLSAGEGCLIHMTSHGAKGQGFYLSLTGGVLPPDAFAKLIDRACGTNPAVILVSACYSGQFITDALKGPNRIILTAARADRPSFGCSADTRYTYWDQCLLDQVPASRNWVDLYKNVQACITKKESALGAQPSEPQAFFGENTRNWEILH